jgi:formylglycine-generating enzyme required for sulfatase activity
MNIGALSMKIVDQTVGIRLVELLNKLSAQIIALQAAAGDKKVSSKEKAKNETKEKAAPKKPSTPKPPKPRAPKPKTPKPKTEKQEDEFVSAPPLEDPFIVKNELHQEKFVDSIVEKETPKEESPFIVPRETEKPVVRSLKYSPDSFSISSRRKNNLRMLRFGGVVLIVLVLFGFGLNFLMKDRPAAAVPTGMPAQVLSTSTSIPSTSTPAPQSTATIAPTEIPPTATLVITPTLGVSSTTTGNDGMTLLYVPEGEFTMGSEASPDEQPIHQVTLSAFWIDQTEVTNAMYEKCVDATQCRPPVAITSNTRDLYFYNPDFGNYPVVFVSSNDANAYCSWAGRRLPTEAEWEKAARGTDERTYPWGNDEPGNNFLNLDIADTVEVGRYPDGSSVYGALDMSGNVYEWVSDWYDAANYLNSPASNPLGPENPIDSNLGELRVLRGGSWYQLEGGFRSADRYQNGIRFNSSFVGFRCALSESP